MKKLLFITACVFFLSSCVTEDGAKKHAAKQAEQVDLKWAATAYRSQKKNPRIDTVGVFDSLEECERGAMQYLEQKDYKKGAYACSAQLAE